MRAKIIAILAGAAPNHVALERVAREMPDDIRSADRALARLGSESSPEELRLASNVRAMALGATKARSETAVEDPADKDYVTQDGGVENEGEEGSEIEDTGKGGTEFDGEDEEYIEVGDETDQEDGNVDEAEGNDPRLHQIGLERNRLNGGAIETEGIFNDMDIDEN